jgi:hypothetical protein
MANQALHDGRRPHMVGDAVEEQAHPVEHTEAEGMRKIAPRSERCCR